MKTLKIIALLLVSFIVLTSCAAVSEEIVPVYDPSVDPDDIDLMGYEYIITAIAHGDGQGAYALNPESGYNVRGDRLLQRYKETEEKYNVTITRIDGIDFGRFLAFYSSGLKYADLMFACTNHIFCSGYIQNGYMHAFSNMDLDLHCGIYGPESALEAGKLGDDYYSVMAYYWGFPAADVVPAMWFNPRTLGSFQQPNPHELAEQGNWNWAQFEEMCEVMRDTSDPDESKHTFAAGYSNEPYFELGALYSNNVHLATINEEGRLVYALNSPEALEAMDFVRSLAERDLIVDIGDRFNITPFVENRSAFFMEYAHMGLSSEGNDNLAYRVDDSFEWIYFPTGPKGSASGPKSVFGFWTRFFYAPANSDMEAHETLLPYLFQPLPGETTENWQDDFERNNFFSKESFNYFVELRDKAVFDYSVFVDFNTNIAPLLKQITRGQKSASESFTSIEEKVQKYIDKNYNDYLK